MVAVAPGSTSRRTLLKGFTGAALATLAGCGGSRPSLHRLAPGERRSEIELINGALDLEHEAIDAYTASIPLLGGRALTAAKHFLDQELAHAGELSGLIKASGGKAVRPRAAYNLGQPHRPEDILHLLRDLEQRQLAYYLGVIPRLSLGPARAAIASVFANDAQHLMILVAELGGQTVPAAFVTGRQ